MFVALFAGLNKRLVLRSEPLTVTAIEMTAGALVLLLVAVVLTQFDSLPNVAGIVENREDIFALPQGLDILWLAILAFACTLLPFALSLIALRQLSAYASALAVNLEPVYAILLAAVLLGEQQELSPDFYLGAILIIAVVLAYPLLMRRGTGPV